MKRPIRKKSAAKKTKPRAPAKKAAPVRSGKARSAATRKVTAGPPARAGDVLPAAGDAFYSAADSLFRCAVESCRQHYRVAQLVERGVGDAELQVAWQVAALCDALLKQVTDEYAPVASQSASNNDDTIVRRNGNALWRASRAFTNRFLDEDHVPHAFAREHSSGDFIDLRLRHELDASSILSLRQAADEYRKSRPAAALFSETGNPPGTGRH